MDVPGGRLAWVERRRPRFSGSADDFDGIGPAAAAASAACGVASEAELCADGQKQHICRLL